MLKQTALLTRPTLAVISPSRPESAETDSSPRDAPFPMLRSHLESILNVARGYSCGASIGCGPADSLFEHPAMNPLQCFGSIERFSCLIARSALQCAYGIRQN